MPRYRLTIEYDGTDFVGWQRQADGLPTVQEVLEVAVERLCGSFCTVHGAGRTDSGVHATGQVAHVDLPRAYPDGKVADALNFHLLPHPVAVLSADIVDDEFHARFSATERAYLYRICDRRPPPVLDRLRVWHLRQRLDAAAMHEAAKLLLGRHDFTTFRAAQCQADSPVRTLSSLDVERVGDEVRVTARARSFLHNQVRSMVGSLKMVGEGKWQPSDLRAALEAADRTRCGPVAPAYGLYLTEVGYGDGKC